MGFVACIFLHKHTSHSCSYHTSHSYSCYTTAIKIIKDRTDLKLNTNIDYTNPNIYSKDWTSEIDQTYQSEVA